MKGEWKSSITAEFKEHSKKNLSQRAWVGGGGGGGGRSGRRATDKNTEKEKNTQIWFASVLPDEIYLQASQKTKHINRVGVKQ